MPNEQGDSTNPTQETADKPTFPWLSGLMKKWAQVRLGHEAMMLDRAQRALRISEVSARNAMTGETSDTSGWPDNQEEGEQMGVKIGDEVHHHYPPPEPTSPSKAASRGLVAKALPYVLAATLGGGGLGAGWLLRSPSTDKPEPPPAVEDVDTDWGIDVKKWVPPLE